MLIGHIGSYIKAVALVSGLDKSRIGNKEFGKERVYAKIYIDLDQLISKGYDIGLIKAMLGQDFVRQCLSNYFYQAEKIGKKRSLDNTNFYLKNAVSILLFREIEHSQMFWRTYQYSHKYQLTFREMAEAFFEYINRDIKQLKKYASFTKLESRALDRFVKSGGDPFETLLCEAEALWKDMNPNFFRKEKRSNQEQIFLSSDDLTEKRTEHMLTQSIEEEKERGNHYLELAKRNYLERIGAYKEDVAGTPYEYLFQIG